jgi:hypothetical protein
MALAPTTWRSAVSFWGNWRKSRPLDQSSHMLSIVRGLAPTDPTEALLAAQMAAVHSAAMVAAGRLARVETIEQQDSASAMLNKLTRTFALQVEALKKHRLKGEQTITVTHVSVSDGGQAIVGNVQQAPGGSLKKKDQSHELTPPNAHGPALFGNIKTNRQSMPSPGGEGQNACAGFTGLERERQRAPPTAPPGMATARMRRQNSAAPWPGCAVRHTP